MTAITSQTTIDITVAGRRLEATLLGDGRTVVAYDNMMGRAAEGGVAHRARGIVGQSRAQASVSGGD